MSINLSTRHLASLVFVAIAAFLVIYTWVPARSGLQHDDGKVTGVIAQPNTWYEVEITTASGSRVSCRSRHGWPLVGPSRCPIDEFQGLVGRSVKVSHDGKHPYEVTAGNAFVIDYGAHRKAQLVAVIVAGLSLAMAALAWRRK